MKNYRTKKETVSLLGIAIACVISCTTIILGTITLGIIAAIHGYFEQWVNLIYVVILAGVGIIFGVLITFGYIHLRKPID